MTLYFKILTPRVFSTIVIRIFLPIFIFFGLTSNLSAQNKWDTIPVMDNVVYQTTIKTVQFFVTGNPISNPVISLNGSNTLTLKFDLLGNDVEDYGYTLVHCNKNWNPTGISSFDFIEGFTQSNIANYEFSFNTTVPYVHYSLEFPNQDIAPKISGNFALIVFDENTGQPVIIRRFCVVEPKVTILAKLERSALPQFYNSHQEINFLINYKNFNLSNAFEEIDITLLQNFNWNLAKYNIKPTFIKEEILEFVSYTKYTFPGLKEFRYTDLRNLDLLHHSIYKISEDQKNITLFNDNINTFKSYDYYRDANGKFLIGVDGNYNVTNANLEADYVNVNFTLETNIIFSTGDLYLIGAFTDWLANDDYKMTYNYTTKNYEGTFLLKQGLYNYMYGFVETDKTNVNCSKFEGSYFETENTYQILVYYKGFGGRYDRLIAYEEKNTLQSN